MKTVIAATSSEDLYGADKIASQVISAISAIDGVRVDLLLPDDLNIKGTSRFVSVKSDNLCIRRTSIPIVRRQNLKLSQIPRMLYRCVAFAWELVNKRPDVVYLATSACILMAVIARVCRTKSVVLHVQELWTGTEGRILGNLARSADQIICISDAVAESMPSYLQNRTTTVTNAVPEYATVDDGCEQSRTETLFLMASRWNSWKGHRTLLDAWRLVEAGNRLIILGGPPEIGAKADVNSIVADMENNQTVEIVGEVEDPYEYFKRVHYTIVPSDKPEPFGLVAIESLSMGRPVIASNGGGLANIIEDGKNGWLFEMGNAEQLSKLINGLNPAKYRYHSDAARRAYEEKFSMRRFDHEITQFFSRILRTL